nr:hypothetical protein [Pandoravirus belohorizontensis]
MSSKKKKKKKKKDTLSAKDVVKWPRGRAQQAGGWSIALFFSQRFPPFFFFCRCRAARSRISLRAQWGHDRSASNASTGRFCPTHTLFEPLSIQTARAGRGLLRQGQDGNASAALRTWTKTRNQKPTDERRGAPT